MWAEFTFHKQICFICFKKYRQVLLEIFKSPNIGLKKSSSYGVIVIIIIIIINIIIINSCSSSSIIIAIIVIMIRATTKWNCFCAIQAKVRHMQSNTKVDNIYCNYRVIIKIIGYEFKVIPW